MKKSFFILGTLFCLYSCGIVGIGLPKIIEKPKIPIIWQEASSRDYQLPDSLTYQVIEIINPVVYNMLDSIINLSKESIFVIHEQPCRYTFLSYSKNDTIIFSFRARQYDGCFYGNIYNNYFAEPPDEYCFAYKGVWFTGFVAPYNNEYFSDYFKLTDQEKKLNIYFPDTKIFYWDYSFIFNPSDEVLIFYQILNNVPNTFRVVYEKIDTIYHKIKKYDTLSELAEKYRTTEKRIRELNPELSLEDKLPVGKEIRVQ